MTVHGYVALAVGIKMIFFRVARPRRCISVMLVMVVVVVIPRSSIGPSLYLGLIIDEST
jgi:hypothetical protein